MKDAWIFSGTGIDAVAIDRQGKRWCIFAPRRGNRVPALVLLGRVTLIVLLRATGIEVIQQNVRYENQPVRIGPRNLERFQNAFLHLHLMSYHEAATSISP